MMKDFYSATDEEIEEMKDVLEEVETGTWMIGSCVLCNKKINLLECDFLSGDPVCKNGCKDG